MFPHTTHTEMVILFERRSKDEISQQNNETVSKTSTDTEETKTISAVDEQQVNE